jgi:hypothetical protein
MIGSAKREDVPESLFSLDSEVSEEPKTTTRTRTKVPPPPDSDASPEFQALITEVSAKQARRSKRSKTIGASVFNRARLEVQEMIESGDWAQCGARHLVALYDLMHLKCYGVEAVELGSTERYNAAMMAANLVKRMFGGDYVSAVEYMRFVWTKEISTEKWRRENGREGRRIGTRLMFGGTLVTDYRLSLARKRHRT